MEQSGRLEGLQRYQIHGGDYVRVFYSLDGAPDDILQCQLPAEAMESGLRPGDPIVLTMLLKTVMAIRRDGGAENEDGHE